MCRVIDYLIRQSMVGFQNWALFNEYRDVLKSSSNVKKKKNIFKSTMFKVSPTRFPPGIYFVRCVLQPRSPLHSTEIFFYLRKFRVLESDGSSEKPNRENLDLSIAITAGCDSASILLEMFNNNVLFYGIQETNNKQALILIFYK